MAICRIYLLDRVLLRGSVWEMIKGTPMENVHNVAIVVVNAETQPDTKWDRSEGMPGIGAMMSAYSSIGIERYNEETIALIKESVKSWADEIRRRKTMSQDDRIKRFRYMVSIRICYRPRLSYGC